MNTWVKRLRGALGMGLIWAAGGVAIGGLIELLDNVLPAGLPITSRVDMWPQTLAIPGFFGGLIFAVVLMIAGGRSRLEELSMPRFAAWGAIAGLLMGGVAMSIGAPVAFLGITALVGAAAGSSYLLLARRAERQELLTARSAEEATRELER
jgi:hypothetical protein